MSVRMYRPHARTGRLVLLLIAALTPSLASLAQPGEPASPFGLWRTQDGGGVIAIARCGAALCAHIAGIVLDHPDDPTPLDNRGASQCGLALIDDATETEPGLWTGHIRDPRNGMVFGVELRPRPDGTLALRGYLGIALLGRTETWTRYPGDVPADCRLIPPGPSR